MRDIQLKWAEIVDNSKQIKQKRTTINDLPSVLKQIRITLDGILFVLL